MKTTSTVKLPFKGARPPFGPSKKPTGVKRVTKTGTKAKKGAGKY